MTSWWNLTKENYKCVHIACKTWHQYLRDKMNIFTESHGSAYIVMRAMQQVSENGNFGVSELCNPWTEWLKSGIAHMIVLATWPRMPNFKFGRTGASGNIFGNIRQYIFGAFILVCCLIHCSNKLGSNSVCLCFLVVFFLLSLLSVSYQFLVK